MNLEEIYATLLGASKSGGAKYDVIKKWFTECQIIDGRFITQDFFAASYERLQPNREDLTLTQFIQLLGILARETRQEVDEFVRKFQNVNQVIIEEIKECYKGNE